RAGIIEAPYLVAGVDVVGRDIAAYAELTARYANNHIAVNDGGMVGHGLTLGRVGVLHVPDFLAGFGVQRINQATQCVEDDLAVTVEHTAVDRIATGHADGRRVGFRLELPGNLIGIVEIDGVHVVGIGRDEIHHLADHQRRPLESALRTGRE